MSRNTYNYKLFAIQAAKDLFYDETVLSALRKAQTEDEITRIMTNARVASK